MHPLHACTCVCMCVTCNMHVHVCAHNYVRYMQHTSHACTHVDTYMHTPHANATAHVRAWRTSHACTHVRTCVGYMHTHTHHMHAHPTAPHTYTHTHSTLPGDVICLANTISGWLEDYMHQHACMPSAGQRVTSPAGFVRPQVTPLFLEHASQVNRLDACQHLLYHTRQLLAVLPYWDCV